MGLVKLVCWQTTLDLVVKVNNELLVSEQGLFNSQSDNTVRVNLMRKELAASHAANLHFNWLNLHYLRARCSFTSFVCSALKLKNVKP